MEVVRIIIRFSSGAGMPVHPGENLQTEQNKRIIGSAVRISFGMRKQVALFSALIITKSFRCVECLCHSAQGPHVMGTLAACRSFMFPDGSIHHLRRECKCFFEIVTICNNFGISRLWSDLDLTAAGIYGGYILP